MLIVGDTHGDTVNLPALLDYCWDQGCSNIVQLGDWGYVWPGKFRQSEVSVLLQNRGIHMYFIDGNHDHHPYLRLLPNSLNNVAPNITYLPRGSYCTIEGSRFASLGGAASIDYATRIEGREYWRDLECVNQNDVDKLEEGADILLLHDSPDYMPEFPLVDDTTFNLRVDNNKALISQAIETVRPELIFHGHMHLKSFRRYKGIPVKGLDCMAGRGYEIKPFDQFTYVI
mgnify:CR=1 FL=1